MNNINQSPMAKTTLIDTVSNFAENVANELIKGFTPFERLEVLNIIRGKLNESLKITIDDTEFKLKNDSDYLNELLKIDY